MGIRRSARLGFLYAAFLAVLCPGQALAHASERMVILTLPTQAYFWGAALAILVTVVVGVTGMVPRFRVWRLASFRTILPEGLTNWFSSVFLWALIAAGFWGSRDPLTNPLPLGVWIGLWVLLPLVTVFLGNVWSAINPWTAPVRAVRRAIGRTSGVGLARLGYWPACVGFFAFAWFEIVSLSPADPEVLARVAALYWLAMFVLGCLEGEAWYEKGEAFTVYFGFLARIAPVWSTVSGRTREVFCGLPGAQIMAMPRLEPSGFAFITLVLAAVSFDGLSETFWWLARNGINPLEFPGRSAVVSINTFGLIGAWAVAALLILGTIVAGRRLAGKRGEFWPDAGLTALSFLPISAGYHIAHYLVALLTNGQYVIVALDDPLGRHWHWLGIPHNWVSFAFLYDPGIVRMIWNIQFALILGAHILAILLSLRITAREGMAANAREHAPMAVLMIFFTIFGLWLLSSPTGA